LKGLRRKAWLPSQKLGGGAQIMPMKNPNHPGDIIRDCLDELGVNVTDGAKALGVTRSALSLCDQPQSGHLWAWAFSQ
jgi:hypothetical protein